jgi:hypothetical protein
VRRSYVADVIDYRLGRIGTAMVFGRAASRAPSAEFAAQDCSS